jgi:hypothetical protein
MNQFTVQQVEILGAFHEKLANDVVAHTQSHPLEVETGCQAKCAIQREVAERRHGNGFANPFQAHVGIISRA